MNNKIFSFILATAISFFAIGCREDANLGTDFLPEGDALNLTITDTLTVKTSTVLDDSLETNNPNMFLLGVYNDPVFGRTKAEFATQFILDASSSYSLTNLTGTAASLIINIPIDTTYDNAFYGNEDIAIQINVRRLKTNLESDEIYYSCENASDYYFSEIIGTGSFSSSLTELSIELNIDLAQQFIDNANTYFSYNDGEDFTEIFNGLYFSVVDNNIDDGFIMRLNPNYGTSIVELSYYPESNPDSLYTYDFQIDSDCISFNTFSHNYENTEVEQAINDTLCANEFIYLQSMAGTKIKLELPYINNFDTVENMVLNKAELVLKASNQQIEDNENYPAIENIALVGYNNEGELSLLPEYLYSTTLTGFEYDSDEDIYKCNVTKQVEDFIYNSKDDIGYDLYLIALQRRSNFGRTILTSGNNENPIKLILTYTKY